MTQEHPITPPPELFKQWEGVPRSLAFEAAYRAGADMELEACCEWLDHNSPSISAFHLRIERRPKPPSLKEQALAQTDALLNDPSRALLMEVRETLELNRRALEALPDD